MIIEASRYRLSYTEGVVFPSPTSRSARWVGEQGVNLYPQRGSTLNSPLHVTCWNSSNACDAERGNKGDIVEGQGGMGYDSAMSADYQPPPRSWLRKFARAFWGIGWSLRTQSSCHVHAGMTLLVLIVGLAFQFVPLQGVPLTAGEWSLLVLSIAGVWSAELLNTAIEQLARQVDRRENLELGQALDIASGGVLCMAWGAAVVGLIVLLPHAWQLVKAVAALG